MRRDQIFKICLNFFLTDEVEFQRKDDSSWTFGANDFSEGEFEAISFAIRFKNKDIAQEFLSSIKSALTGGSVTESDQSELVKRLQLPPTFFAYLNAPDCAGCIGCKSEDYVFKRPVQKEVFEDFKPIPLNAPRTQIKLRTRKQSQDRHVSFNLSEKREEAEKDKLKSLFAGTEKSPAADTSTIFGGIKKSEAASNIFAKFQADNPPASESVPQFGTNTFGTPIGSSNLFTSKPTFTADSGTSIFSSSLNTTPIVPQPETKPAETTSLFGVKTNFSFSAGNGVFGGATAAPKENGTSIFSSAATAQTPVFGSNIFGGGPALSFGSSAAAKTEASPFGAIKTTFTFAETSKELKADERSGPILLPDFLKKENESAGGFAALAAAVSPEKSFFSASGNNSAATAAPGGFYGLTVKDDFFSRNAKKADGDTSQNDNEEASGGGGEDNYDPHYDPIISLPDEIKVSTGEEDEKKIFGDRAKLFRYDVNTKEWKERGKLSNLILHCCTTFTRFHFRRWRNQNPASSRQRNFPIADAPRANLQAGPESTDYIRAAHVADEQFAKGILLGRHELCRGWRWRNRAVGTSIQE